MARVLRTSKAEEDLLEIWSYIADDNIDAADEFLDQIVATCRTLSDNPAAGRSRDELAQRLRSFPLGNYVIFYRPLEDGIVVIRVLHGARDLPGIL
jgi:toxin ParE1/3/4